MKDNNEDKYKNTPIGTWLTQGNITEQALIKFFMDEYGPEGCNDKKKSLADVKETVIQFTSQRKKASVVVKTDTGYRIYCKGAPDILMPATNWIVLQDGNVAAIDAEAAVDPSLLTAGESEGVQDSGMGILNRTISQFAKQAFRTILLTYKDFTEDEY